MFFSLINKPQPIAHDRTILTIGGSGVLGGAFLAKKGDDTFVINVSRRGVIIGEGTYSIRQDVRKNPEKLLHEIGRITPMVDVLIMMAYDHSFTSVENLDRDTFLREIELDTLLPIQLGVLSGKIFWSTCGKELNIEKGRKVIYVSSGAAYGKTMRPELASYSGAKAALNIMAEYLHEYLFSTYGVSTHIVAPGTLKDARVKEKTVDILWELERAMVTQFTTSKIFKV